MKVSHCSARLRLCGFCLSFFEACVPDETKGKSKIIYLVSLEIDSLFYAYWYVVGYDPRAQSHVILCTFSLQKSPKLNCAVSSQVKEKGMTFVLAVVPPCRGQAP